MRMEFTAKQIADLINGKIEGNPGEKIYKLSKIEEGEKGSLSFLSNPLYTNYIYNTNASVVIVNEGFVPEKPVTSTLIKVVDSYTAFAKLLEIYNEIRYNKTGISEKAHISETSKIGNNV